ncbi:MAG: substrate-binding domain-containing protein [Muribaculaceae bacterium]|nr:substrate-binding domain-containing protein [Muribaculaceae bacterium]
MKMRIRTIMRWSGLAVAMIAPLCALTSCGDSGKSKKEGLKTAHTSIACDASFENIMSQEIDVFEYTYRDKYRDAMIIPYYTSQRAAVDSLLDKSVKTIVIPRELTKEEVRRLKSQKRNPRQQRIAVDAIALIVNKDNPLEIISMKELRQILSGELTRWDEIEPSRLGSIQAVFDQNGSSTAQYMRDSLLNGGKFGENVFAENSNPEVFKAVTERKNALGIIGVSWISSDMSGAVMSREELLRQSAAESDTTRLSFNSDIKVLKVRRDDSIEAYKPYQAYIFDGSYPLYRSIFMITTSVGGTLDSKFYAFVTGYQGQKVIQLTGILPAVVQPRMVNVSR